MKFFVAVWIGLMCIVGVEVIVTYRHLPPRQLIVWLLLLAFLEAGIALWYFMHLKYERAALVWSLVPAFVFVVFLMDHLWPDAFRMASMRLLSQ
jgi:heme/copper-type cytochrome/quinol oxidase subunit 4